MRKDKKEIDIKYPFKVDELNEILNRRRSWYDDETMYLINCLWNKANKIANMNIELMESNKEIALLCWEAIRSNIKNDYFKNSELRELKKNSEEMIREITGAKDDRKINLKVRFDILYRDNFTCTYCWRKAPDVILHIDHKLPFSKWWETTKENLITSCSDCNLWKKNRYDTTEKQ